MFELGERLGTQRSLLGNDVSMCCHQSLFANPILFVGEQLFDAFLAPNEAIMDELEIQGSLQGDTAGTLTTFASLP